MARAPLGGDEKAARRTAWPAVRIVSSSELWAESASSSAKKVYSALYSAQDEAALTDVTMARSLSERVHAFGQRCGGLDSVMV